MQYPFPHPSSSIRRSYALCAALCLTATSATILAPACTDSTNVDGTEPKIVVEPEVAWPQLGCDPLVPSYCGFPFPSNVHTVPDETSPTGRRVAFTSQTFPIPKSGVISAPDAWNKSDGFSASSALLAELPGATSAGLPSSIEIEKSIEADSPTVLLDTETGERVPHFAELDASIYAGETPTFMIRPAVRLEDGRRYIVAIRNVLDAESNPLPALDGFAALRNQTATDDPDIDVRRGLYEDIFQHLANAGVERETLQLAWDFTTASRENNTGWLVHMRDEALGLIGDAPAYTITDVRTDFKPENIAYRIEGTMTVPLYLDIPEAGGRLLFGADGMPEPNPSQPTYEVPFLVLIPHAATQTPGALMQYGHGLLGSFDQIEAFDELANLYNYVIFGMTLEGMGGDDGLFIAAQLVNGDLENLATMFDRLHQGMTNYLMNMRMMRTSFANDPTYGAFINPDERYYHGISQGGIFGGTYVAASTDVQRGVLGVMGQPYNLLLNRSVDFNPFFAIMALALPDARDQQMALGLVQMLWDRTEPAGYTKYMAGDTLPGTPDHAVLMRAAVGDHQVTNLGAHIMARTTNATHVDTGVREIFGLQAQQMATSGSSYVEYAFGLPDDPVCNVPQTACDDPHGSIRRLPEARMQLDHFLRTGETVNFCPDGVCSYPEMSGCTGNESEPFCPE